MFESGHLTVFEHVRMEVERHDESIVDGYHCQLLVDEWLMAILMAPNQGNYSY